MTAVLKHRRRGSRRFVAALAPLFASGLLIAGAPSANAAQAQVGLGTADSFAVLAGSTITNTGPTVVDGDVGVSPGSAITGFPPGMVNNGVIHAADGVAAQAQQDLTTAYDDAAGRTPSTSVSGDLVGQTLTPGVYKSTSSLGLTGTVTLDAQGDSHAVFIFQIASTLITGSNGSVNLIGGAQACNVFWQVGSSATLGTGTTFRGNILALTSITATTGATIDGRALARNGAVTLDTNTITRTQCATTTTTTTLTSSTATPTVGQPVTFTATTTSVGDTAVPTGSVEFKEGGTVLGTSALNSTGQATFTTSTLGPGVHIITAVYLGASGFSGSTSAPVTESVRARSVPPTRPPSGGSPEAPRLAETGFTPWTPIAGAVLLISGVLLSAGTRRARRH
jgi:hypothetical protein